VDTASVPSRAAAPELARHLARARYLRLTTFRKSGAAVATPVWFALAGDRAYAMSDDNAGKVRRIRNTGGVRVAPSDWRGRPTGGELAATAAVIADPAERAAAERALRDRYGWQWRALAWLGERRRRRTGTPDPRVFLAITAA
jgi:uncharacterized protein